MYVWVVSYCDDNDTEPTTSVFRYKHVAASCFRAYVGAGHQRVAMQERLIYSTLLIDNTKSIEALNLSSRATLCLKRNGINTIDELLSISKDNLVQIKGLGTTLIREIIDCVHNHNLSMLWEVDNG